MNQLNEQPEQKQEARRTINCDQVCWIMDALERLTRVVGMGFPSISRHAATARLSALLEIMDILGLRFEDPSAAVNALRDMYEITHVIAHRPGTIQDVDR